MGNLRLPATVLLLAAALCVNHVVHSLSLASASSNEVMAREKRSAAQLLPANFSILDVQVLVCINLQLEVPSCTSVPTFQARFGGEGSRGSGSGTIAGVPVTRTKRDTKGSWKGFPSFPDFDSSSYGYGSYGSNYFGSSSYGKSYRCPSQVKQSQLYDLSADNANYPAVAIANELNSDPVRLRFLSQEIVLDTDPPFLFFDDFLTRSNASCPFTQLKLTSYFSPTARNRCFFLRNFQEDLLYRVTSTETPRNCNQASDDDLWSSAFGSASDTQNDNQCVTQYELASFWAYCSNLPASQRIIRDRIIVPKAVAPFSVPCKATS